MKLTRYGYDVIRASLLIALVLIIVGAIVSFVIVKVLLIALGVLLTAFTLYFFRDPERTTPSEPDDVLISPADGKVVLIKDLIDEEYHNGPAKQISIFLSPLNVHVNRIPTSGVVDYYKYIEGKYLVAFNEKSSELNERTHIGIRNGRVKFLMRQIAGAVARRIVCELKVGDEVRVGERFGMIKFGSRTDLIVPPQMLVEVKLGDIVVGGETIICRMPQD